MIKYMKNEPMIYIHIPKCAGTSVSAILRKWFGERFLRHVFNEHHASFAKKAYCIEPGMCIAGHFNRSIGCGVETWYPSVNQFCTFLRDPLETAISGYYFFKKKRRAIRIDQGTLEENSALDSKSIDDWFIKRPKSQFLNFLPVGVNLSNYRVIIDSYYFHIGTVENLQQSMDILADKMSFDKEKIIVLNKTERDEVVDKILIDRFKGYNELEYKIYDYVSEKSLLNNS